LNTVNEDAEVTITSSNLNWLPKFFHHWKVC